MNERISFDTREMKMKKNREQRGYCPACNKQLLAGAQLAHRINQGPNNIRNLEREYSGEYGRGIGKRIIHHPLNMALTCPGCNHKSLIDNRPVDRVKLIRAILADIGGKHG